MALTPMFRRLFFIGVPLSVLVSIMGMTLADPKVREEIVLSVGEFKNALQTREEFMVKLMAIDGASDGVAEDIREITALDFPISSFDLDLDGVHRQIMHLDAVARADLRIRAGGVLELSITERVPAVIWRSETGLELLDKTGKRVAALDSRTDRPDLPVIAGDGAELAVSEALDLLTIAAPLADRVRGLVRVGVRRWDVILDRDQLVMLPQDNARQALERVIALHQAKDILSRDVASVDMRQAQRPTVRMRAATARVLREIKLIELGED